MASILTVCLGNICRSPLAQGIIEHLAQDIFINVDSAGTSAFHRGSAPDLRAQRVAQRHGFDISHLRARPLMAEDFDHFDIILAMDRENYSHCLQLAPPGTDFSKIRLFLEHYGTGVCTEVPDPYYGNMDDFEHVYELLYDASLQLVEELLNEHGAGTE